MYHAVKYPDGYILTSARRLHRLRTTLREPNNLGTVVIFDDRGRQHGWYDTKARQKPEPQPFEWCPIRKIAVTPQEYS